jgi:DNA invertase Pin-like site-specific DNA recombinase
MNRLKAYSYIRFSTPEQGNGDSLRRQIQGAKDYAKKHGYTLDDSLKLRDRGLSAYKGHHRSRGILGHFLNMVNEGKIPTGSILIVEHLDRLSRENILIALSQFTEIIKAGVEIATLWDGKRFSEQSITDNHFDLLYSINYMMQAHSESKIKSERLRSAWSNKRKKAKEKKLTARCPAWLRLNKNRAEFIVIDERDKIIEKIFKMKLEGKGSNAIARELNECCTWQPKNGWRKSYINKILRTRAVIGEFQPHKNVDGKRKPVGNPIPNYFPKVVSEKLFYGVQEQIKRNRYFGGKTGKVSNLFGGLVKCAYCSAPMQFVDKGKPPKGRTYFVCDNARRGRGCIYYSVRYDIFEETVLEFAKDLDVTSILPKQGQIEYKIQDLRNQLIVVKGKLDDIKRQKKNLAKSIGENDDDHFRKELEMRLSEIITEGHGLIKDRVRINRDLERILENKQRVIKNIEIIDDLSKFIKSIQGQELIEVRLKLRESLRNLIRKINLHPAGPIRITNNYINELIADILSNNPELEIEDVTDEFIKNLEKNAFSRNPGLEEKIENNWISEIPKNTFKNKKYCQAMVYFKTGSFRLINLYRRPRLELDYYVERGDKLYRFNKDGNFSIEKFSW